VSSSNMKALEMANKGFAILERDAEAGCEHCKAVLKEIFDNNKGSRPEKAPEPRTGQAQSPQDVNLNDYNTSIR
jgi:hypothetical protein